MKTPSFWYDTTDSVYPALLSPFAALYAHISKTHQRRASPQKAGLPVICLGNLVAGGSGKTPTAIALAKLLHERGIFSSPGFLTRGYGGKSQGLVGNEGTPEMWGDEALLLRRHAPTFVARNRFVGATLIARSGCDAIIMDDGLQHYTLAKDVSIAVVDGRMGFGNRKVIPAGPLRQSLSDGLSGADAFILIGDDVRNIRLSLPADKPVFTAVLAPRPTVSIQRSQPYVAFCGIGFPEKFRATLESAGIPLSGWHSFGDHHVYTRPEIASLLSEAEEKKSRLITTEKDYVRLPDFPEKHQIDVLPVEILFAEPDDLARFIRNRIAAKFDQT